MSRVASQATKYADEVLDQVVEFAAAISAGAISAAEGDVTPGVTLAIGAVTPNGTTAAYRVTGGLAGERHSIDITVTMSTGEKLTHRIVYTVI